MDFDQARPIQFWIRPRYVAEFKIEFWHRGGQESKIGLFPHAGLSLVFERKPFTHFWAGWTWTFLVVLNPYIFVHVDGRHDGTDRGESTDSARGRPSFLSAGHPEHARRFLVYYSFSLVKLELIKVYKFNMVYTLMLIHESEFFTVYKGKSAQ